MSNQAPYRISVATKYGPNNELTFWTNIGRAWPLKNGKGFSIELTAHPIGRKMVMFANEQNEDGDES